MFEYLRTHQRLMQFILLLLIIPSFALVGISSYLGSGNEVVVAEVAGQKISQQEFDNALRNRMDQMRQQLGAQFDEAMFNTPLVKQAVLDGLISQRVLQAQAQKDRLNVPEAALQQAIMAIPGLTLPDGAFDYDGYRAALANQGLTPAMYESNVKQDLAVQQLTNVVEKSAMVPKTVLTQVEAIMNQQRDIQTLDINAAGFVSQVNVTDAMLKAYYDKHSAQFSTPESASIEYITLNKDAIAAHITVSDADIKSYYDQNIKNYSTEEQRRARHILIKVDKDASVADKNAAKAKAEEVLALVKKNPQNFAELAKQYSQDEGSAQEGGDLGYIGKDMMIKPVEEAVFSLKQGEISNLVKSDFGYHIIEVTGIKPATVKPLADVKAQIESDIKAQQVAKKWSEMAEGFTNTVYEQPDSLKPAADKFNLPIEKADNLTRKPDLSNPAVRANPVLANQKLLSALFSDDVIKNKNNTEAIEVSPNTLVAARVVDYKPASKRPFDQVKDVITMFVKIEESEALAKKAGEEKLAKLKATPDDAGFGPNKVVSRLNQNGLQFDAFNLVMNADASKLPAFVGISLPGQGYTIYRINKLSEASPDAARTADLSKQYNDMVASEDLYDYVAMLKAKDGVKILRPLQGTDINR